LRLEYKTSADPFRVRLATIIQAQLARVGVEVKVRSLDWGTFYGDVKGGRFQMYSLTWVGIKTPDQFRYIFHSQSVPPDGANRGRYRSVEADRLIEQAEAETDLAGQARRYHRLQHHLLKDLPYIPLWYEDQVAAFGDAVSGYELVADGGWEGLVSIERGVDDGG
jgi:peptide/nickel transport system substrate-binding protein